MNCMGLRQSVFPAQPQPVAAERPVADGAAVSGMSLLGSRRTEIAGLSILRGSSNGLGGRGSKVFSMPSSPRRARIFSSAPDGALHQK